MCAAVAVFVILGSLMSSDIRHAAAQVTGVDFVMMTHSVGAHFDNNGSIHVIDTVANHQTRDAVGNLNHS